MAQQGVTNDQLLSVINSTLSAFKKGSLHVAFSRNTYEILNRWFQRDKITVTGGADIRDQIILDDNGTARHVLLYEGTQTEATDHIHIMRAPWRQVEAYWVVERREVLRNMGARQIVSLLKGRRVPAILSLAGELETKAWATPDAADERVPYSIPYFVPQLNAGETGEGFYGGISTGFSDVAGIVPATSDSGTSSIAGGKEGWRSYCAGGANVYTAIDTTLLDSMVKAYISIHFESPFILQDVVAGPLSNYRIYVNKDTLVGYERLVRQHNDNIGSDLAKFHGITSFKRVPLIYVNDLDSDTMDPFYFVNHAYFHPYVLQGDYLRETKAKEADTQHNVFRTFFDMSYNYLCVNRQRQAVLAKTA